MSVISFGIGRDGSLASVAKQRSPNQPTNPRRSDRNLGAEW
jgi:hypothetical protein